MLVLVCLIGIGVFSTPVLAQQSPEHTNSEPEIEKHEVDRTLSFLYPKDWVLRYPIVDPPSRVNILNISLKNIDGKKQEHVDGQIAVYFPRTHDNKISHDEIVNMYKIWWSEVYLKGAWNLNFSNLKESQMPGLQALKIDPNVKAFSGFIYEPPTYKAYYEGSSHEESYEIWFTVLTLDHSSMLITLLTNTKHQKPELWQENTQVYLNVIESLLLQEECVFCFKLSDLE